MSGRRSINVIIMCKAPVAGRVKTRLIGTLTAENAAQLHARMAMAVIERARRLFGDIFIAADDPKHPFFSRFKVPLLSQGDGDLGVRMDRLMRQAFAGGAEAVLILGTDSPHMRDERLLEAYRQLRDHDVVIAPVEDGGYELIAMSAPYPLFDHICWSSEQVLSQTLALAKDQGLRVALLEAGFDLDRPEDLERAGWAFS